MKDNRASIATAVVLGVVLMVTTFWVFPSEVVSPDAPGQWTTPLTETAQRLKGFSEVVVSTPADLTSVGLMLGLGTVCALGVALYLKKRTV